MPIIAGLVRPDVPYEYTLVYADGDKKIEIYELLNDSKLKAKKKRAISRLKAKTNVNQSTSVSTEQPVTEVQSIN